MKNKIIFFIIIVLIAGFFAFIKFKNDSDYSDNKKRNIQIENPEIATLAGGCFWCMEAAFEAVDGVGAVISGYSGGEKKSPTYKEVVIGGTGHLEAVQVYYDPNIISYEEIIDYYWRNIDPVDTEGQFVDKGSSYKSAIFFHNENQKQIAEESRNNIEKLNLFDESVVTEIIPFKEFWEAEDYHQDYYLKRTLQYKIYEKGSGREKRLKELWE